MLNTSENLAQGALNIFFKGSSTASINFWGFVFVFFLEHKSEIAHRYNDLKEETFKAV